MKMEIITPDTGDLPIVIEYKRSTRIYPFTTRNDLEATYPGDTERQEREIDSLGYIEINRLTTLITINYNCLALADSQQCDRFLCAFEMAKTIQAGFQTQTNDERWENYDG